MIQGFRKLFQSRIGVFLALAFVGVIALAFASADITGGSFGGIGGGERVAAVGDQQISTSTYRETLNGAFEQARQENPTLTMQQFLDGGGRDGVLDNMVERMAIYAFALDHGLRIGDSLIGSELKDIPAFQGPDGKFSQEMYTAALQQRGISEKLLRTDLGQGLAARMTLVPAQIGTAMPEKIARQYAKLLNETRKGSVALIPSEAFAKDVKVTDKLLQSYLASNRARYSLPERRTIRFAVLDKSGLEGVTATDAEIAARYEQNRAVYSGKEGRTLTQLVLPTEPAAKAVLAEITSPSQMGAVAQGKGLSTTQIVAADRADLSAKTSPAVTQAAYEAKEGTIAGPVKGPLGWYLLRVDAVTRTNERSLAQVRDEIAATITEEKRNRALADRAAKAEEELNSGASLAEIARSFGKEVATTAPLLANGNPFANGAAPDPQVLRIVPAAFAMSEDSDPQIAIAADGQSYIIYAPGKVTASAPPPFAEIKPILDRDYRLKEGSKQAAAAADKVLAAIRQGKSPAEAMKLVGKPMPPVDNIDLSRQALMGSGREVPAPLALMFTMAKGSTKKLEAPRNLGWMIVDLDDIVTQDVAADDPLVLATRRQLGPQIGGELGEQLTQAIIADVGVSRNDTAIKAVIDQLVGNR
ncbi:SurA N-terminal domain-containing protein [Croceicoccus bisphenolivorans]|uniref:SurA N-terminal domain-containing protein n=1 Tax=Croceicoccus bisphenolivorans TaxID=1783232 RepID=UPI000837175C|nr:SurA N-terminal domain-containing protein [Croceicoccus bisphenolivorans]